MSDIVPDPNLVAYCGLYCGACNRYRKGACPGCHENRKATWCRVRSCCRENNYLSCADCSRFSAPSDCKMFNNFVSRMFGLIFRSNRAACIQQIKTLGLQGHAETMAKNGLHSIRR